MNGYWDLVGRNKYEMNLNGVLACINSEKIINQNTIRMSVKLIQVLVQRVILSSKIKFLKN